jgi:hypothetical protein
MDGTVSQADLLKALQEARRDGASEAPPQLLQRLERARELFRVALQTEQPALRTVVVSKALGISTSKTRAVIRHLCDAGEIRMKRIMVINTAGASQPVPAYMWINSENAEKLGNADKERG